MSPPGPDAASADDPRSWRKPPTLATVAASAGVSVATVSKVLNDRADVSAATRDRVQAMLRRHDYVARGGEVVRRGGGPRPETPATVELVVHQRLSSYFSEILQGVLEVAGEAEVGVAVSVRPRSLTGTGVEGSSAWARRLARLGRTAVIDVVDDARHGDLSALARSRLPLVLIDPLNLPEQQVTSVGVTNFSGAYTATQHLLSLGHRRIGYLGAVPDAAYNRARSFGFRAAMDTAGVPVPNGFVRSGDHHHQAGMDGAAVLLDLPDRPTAIFAATDEIAAGVYEAARVRGLRVPEDLSVVGFDDTDVARLLSPPLTTIRQPLREMGRVALRTALRLAAGDQPDSHHVELATELVVRSSTAPAHAG